MAPDQPGDLDRTAAHAMYREYAVATSRADDEEVAVERFGDSAALADELLGLVLDGTKRATAGLVEDFAADGEPLPRNGGHWIVCDGAGVPRCILRSVDLRLGRLDGVDDAFAWDEGEGDRSRESWLRGHERYCNAPLRAAPRSGCVPPPR